MSLQDIFDKQQEFESLFVDFPRIQGGDHAYLDETADYLSTALAREAFEFRDEFNWKVSKAPRPHNRDKQIEEAVDCFIFSINQLLILGLTCEEAMEWVETKIRMNWDRQVKEGNVKAINRAQPEHLEVQGLS